MISREAHFQYLRGLSVEKFHILFEIVSPYTDAIIYSDCKGNGTRILDKSTELLTFNMTTFTTRWCCVFYVRPWEKHCLSDLCWIGSILSSKLNLKPCESCLLKNMPDIFVKAGHRMTDNGH